MSTPLQERIEKNTLTHSHSPSASLNKSPALASDTESQGSRSGYSTNSENDPHRGVKRKRKPKKWTYGQLVRLQQLYGQTTHPTTSQRSQLASELGVEEVQVMYWFDSNRRKRTSRLCQQIGQQLQHQTQTTAPLPRVQEQGRSAPPLSTIPEHTTNRISSGNGQLQDRLGSQTEEVIVLEDSPEEAAGFDIAQQNGLCQIPAAGKRSLGKEEQNRQETGLVLHDGAEKDPRDRQDADDKVGTKQLEGPSELIDVDLVDCAEDSKTRHSTEHLGTPELTSDSPTTAPKNTASCQRETASATLASTKETTSPLPERAEGDLGLVPVTQHDESASVSQQKQLIEPHAIPSWTPVWITEQLLGIGGAVSRIKREVETVQPLCQLPEAPLVTLSKAQVVTFLPGCRLTMEELLLVLHREGISTFNVESLRNCILDLATRKSLRVIPDEEVEDPLNDTRDSLWVWEVRLLQSVPRHLQPQAKAIKSRLNEAGTNLKLLEASRAALEGAKIGKSRSKAEKAWNKVKHLLSGNSVGQNNAADSTPISKAVASPGPTPAKAGSTTPGLPSQPGAVAGSSQPVQPVKETEAQLARERKAQEKEALRAQKEAKKEAAKQEKAAKEAEREQHRLEREKEREQQRNEKKLKTELAGFGSMKTIEKSRNAFTKFFKKTPAPVTTKPDLKPTPSPIPASPLSVRTLTESYSPATQDPLRAKVVEIDRQMQRSGQQPSNNQQQIIGAWKRHPKHKRVPGLPPSWARKLSGNSSSGFVNDSELQVVEENFWRRKLLWFPAEMGNDGLFYEQPHWASFYGSWPKTSKVVTARRPFAKDPDLDYEVMEDEEWEPEPEGDNLSNDDGEENEPLLPDESGTDSFFVPDGQLSDDEGISSAQQGVDDLCADQLDSGSSALAIDLDDETSDSLQTWRHASRLFDAAMRKAHPRPLIISRLSSAADSSGHIGCLTGEASLLSAFTIQVVSKDVKVKVPEVGEGDELEDEVGSKRTHNPTGPAGERPMELIPNLIDFLKAHPHLRSVPKVVQGFCDAHPERKLVKKWVADKVKELAERGVMGWKIKAEMPAPVDFGTNDNDTLPQQELANSGPTDVEPSVQPVDANQRTLFSLLPKKSQTGTGTLQRTGEIPYQMSAEDEKKLAALKDCQADGLSSPGWKFLGELLGRPQSFHTSENVQSMFRMIGSCSDACNIPSFTVAALLKTLASSAAAPRLRAGCANSLAHVVHLLKDVEDPVLPTPSKVWGDFRTVPDRVTMDEIFSTPQLAPTILDLINSQVSDLATSAANLLKTLLSSGLPDGDKSKQSGDIPTAAEDFRCGLARVQESVSYLCRKRSDSQEMVWLKAQCLGCLIESETCSAALISHRASFQSLLETLCLERSSASEAKLPSCLRWLVKILHRVSQLGAPFPWQFSCNLKSEPKQLSIVDLSFKAAIQLIKDGLAAMASRTALLAIQGCQNVAEILKQMAEAEQKRHSLCQRTQLLLEAKVLAPSNDFLSDTLISKEGAEKYLIPFLQDLCS